jgi:exopolyphosphatase / guanosine-5'-triphosphate,3'-diphosphate pyrophosphatase
MLAAVDLGSNSFRLHIGHYDGERIRILSTAREPVRLGAGLDRRGNLTAAAMDTALACLHRFGEILRSQPLTAVRVVGTNTLRIAKNRDAFLPLAEKAIGFPIEIISGEEEGRLIYLGVASSLDEPNERRLVIDIGGGSTELVLGQGNEIEHVESFSIGTVKTASEFFPDEKITEPAFANAVLHARSVFEDQLDEFHPRLWTVALGSSGTVRTLADLIEANYVGDGTLSLKSLRALRDYLLYCGRISKIDLEGIKPERIAVVLGGLPVLIGLCEELGIKELQPVEAGLRMGVLWDLHLRQSSRDRRRDSVKEFSKKFGVNQSRANKVKQNTLLLHAQLQPESDYYDRLLGWAACLHEVGMSVSHSGFHKHGAYLVLHADLPGFTKQEQHILSILLLAQKGNLRKVSEAIALPDLAKAILALRLGILFSHSRIDLNEHTLRLKLRQKIDLDLPTQIVRKHPTLTHWLTKEEAAWAELDIPMTIRSH